MRLRDTVILYDGLPYYVLNVSNHRKDGVFRIYLCPLLEDMPIYVRYNSVPLYGWSSNEGEYAREFDKWLENNEESGILRKRMDSPLFNKFRPFPLGMCNYDNTAIYLTRSPTRHTTQGLSSQSLRAFSVSLDGSRETKNIPTLDSQEIASTILGSYPSPEEVLKGLTNPLCENTSAAFHREFALVRGPLDLLFLAYKTDVVGLLTESNFGRVQLASTFGYLTEVVEGLNLFSDVVVK